MKAKLLLLNVLLLCMNCRAQDSFTKCFGGEGFDRGMYITHTSDDGYIACGYSTSFGNNEDIYVVKTDKNANLQWQKNYGGSRFEMGWSIIELNNTGYLLMGDITVSAGNNDICLLRLDIAGNIIWQKTYGSDKYERATQVIHTSDNNFLLIGQRNIDSTNIDSYILKIDTAGNLLWEKTFGGKFKERAFYGAETPGGNFLICGLILPYKNDKADILLIKITPGGELLWTKTYGEENTHEIAHSFCLNKDKMKYTLSGYRESAAPGFHDGLFMQVDEAGKLLMQKQYHSGQDLRLMHAEETENGNFIVAGFTRKDTKKDLWDAALLLFDQYGETKWLKTFGTPGNDDQGYWVVVDSDGGFTLVGYTRSYGKNGDLWIIKTNAGGD